MRFSRNKKHYKKGPAYPLGFALSINNALPENFLGLLRMARAFSGANRFSPRNLRRPLRHVLGFGDLQFYLFLLQGLWQKRSFQVFFLQRENVRQVWEL